MKKPIRLKVISDIHLGHKRNSALEIIANLKRAVGDNPETSQLDIIFLAGDVFDTLLNLPHDAITEIDSWIKSLLHVCAKHNILLRILEGTPSHDWKQSQRFIDINELWQMGAKVAYKQFLEIEYIPEIDRTVLYVPDQQASSTEITLNEVYGLMRAKDLQEIDIAIMHGQFDYQVPPQATVPKHDSAAYLKFVRELIAIGHDHHHSRHEKIIAQGSFDRLVHNEEEPKGHIEVYLHGDGNSETTFIETVNAKRFVTVDVQGLDVEEALAKINHQAKDLPTASFIRIKVEQGHPLITQPMTLVRTWPLFHWSRPKIVVTDEAQKQTQDESSPVPKFTPVTITKDNVTKLLLDQLSIMTTDVNLLEHASLILEEMI